MKLSLTALFLGSLQGLTEFLPISSSGHLYLASRILRNINDHSLFFFVWLHLATLLAILFFFRRRLKSFLQRRVLIGYILLVTGITAMLGIIIEKYTEQYFSNRYFIAFAFFITAVSLLSIKKYKVSKSLGDFNLKDALILGFIQALAVIPGISRSGITIVALIKRQFIPEDAFNLSFLMAIPIILGAFVWELKDIINDTPTIGFSFFLQGFILSALMGFLALKWLLRVINRHKLYVFGYYCLLIGVLSLGL